VDMADDTPNEGGLGVESPSPIDQNIQQEQ
jgi:hypothetical protein